MQIRQFSTIVFIASSLLLSSCDTEESKSLTNKTNEGGFNNPNPTNDDPTEGNKHQTKAETLFSDYSPFTDNDLFSMTHERSQIPQVSSTTDINGLWLFTHHSTITKDDGDVIKMASKSIAQLKVNDDGSITDYACDNDDTDQTTLTPESGAYSYTKDDFSNNVKETIHITFNETNAELTGTIHIDDLDTGDTLATADIRAYKVSNSSNFSDLSIGDFQLTHLNTPLNPEKAIDEQKEFSLHCVDYSEERTDYALTLEEQGLGSTPEEHTAELFLSGSNSKGETINLTIERNGSSYYSFDGLKSLTVEVAYITLTDEENEDITSMPVTRTENDGELSSSYYLTDYVLGFRGLSGAFNADHTPSNSGFSGSVDARF